MFGIVITTHGNFAEGIAQSVNMVIGGDIIPNLGLDESGVKIYEEKLFNLLDKEFETKDGIVVMCDLKGGTPFNTALKYKYMKNKNLEVITGVNLPMIIDTHMEIENFENLLEIVNCALEVGKESIENINL